MKYILLIYQDEKRWSAIDAGEQQKIYAEFGKIRERLVADGQYLDGSQLQLATTASNIRIRDGKEFVTDGPFAETHEQLGGYFLIEVNSATDAIAIAKQIPIARTGTVEVRALVDRAAEAHA